MRLINRDKLLETYKKWIPQLLSKEDEGDRRGVETCIMVLEDMQTVDAVPVVRCRECKHFRHYGKTSLFINGKNIKAGWCQRRISYDEEYRMTADDFFSYGERKGGAE